MNRNCLNAYVIFQAVSFNFVFDLVLCNARYQFVVDHCDPKQAFSCQWYSLASETLKRLLTEQAYPPRRSHFNVRNEVDLALDSIKTVSSHQSVMAVS